MAENSEPVETDETDETDEKGKKKEKTWESFPESVYAENARRLVHHSWKVSNSNATAGGVRLSKFSALSLPYVSARTLVAVDVSLVLDYMANAGKTAKVIKQMRSVERADEFSKKAPASEVAAVRRVLDLIGSGFEEGADFVDARLRQLLLPKAGSYVSVSPITSSGLCSLFFDSDAGLLARHEEELARQRKAALGDVTSLSRRRLNRIQLGIGGSNPQNVGSLVRTMQRPLFVPGPQTKQSARSAFAIYYKGIELRAPVDLLLQYESMRKPIIEGSDGGTDLQSRLNEEAWTREIASRMASQGAAAFETLRSFVELLPREELREGPDFPEGIELVSRSVSAPIRGLIDSRLREKDWSRSIAIAVMKCLMAAKRNVQGEDVALLAIDGPTRAKLTGLLEEAFQ